jgi:hypothetical protein
MGTGKGDCLPLACLLKKNKKMYTLNLRPVASPFLLMKTNFLTVEFVVH